LSPPPSAKPSAAGLAALGFELFADPRFASKTVTAAKLPEGHDWKAFNGAIKSHGVVLAGGQGKLTGKIFRLGHLGSVTVEEILGAIAQRGHRQGHRGETVVEVGSEASLLQQTLAPNADALKVLQRERGYFTANALRMQYPVFRKRGLPLASGAVEGGAKHLVQQRMKRAGMRWSELGARAILHLRCDALTAAASDLIAS
jgi:hypothetical protein